MARRKGPRTDQPARKTTREQTLGLSSKLGPLLKHIKEEAEAAAQRGETITLVLTPSERETLIGAVQQNCTRKPLSAAEKENLATIMHLLIQKGWALQAPPAKGAKEKDFRKSMKRMGWESPPRGKRATYDSDAIKGYYETNRSTLPHETKDEKWKLIEMVRKQFDFPTINAAYQYLKIQGIKGLPWQE